MFCNTCYRKENRIDPDLGRYSDCEAGNRIPTFIEVWNEYGWPDRFDCWIARMLIMFLEVILFISRIMKIVLLLVDIEYPAFMFSIHNFLMFTNWMGFEIHTLIMCSIDFDRLYIVHAFISGTSFLLLSISWLIRSLQQQRYDLLFYSGGFICVFFSWTFWNVQSNLMYIRNMDNVIRFRDVHEYALCGKLWRSCLVIFVIIIVILSFSCGYGYLSQIQFLSTKSFAFFSAALAMSMSFKLPMYLALERKKRRFWYLCTEVNRMEVGFMIMYFIIAALPIPFLALEIEGDDMKDILHILVCTQFIVRIAYDVLMWHYSANELNVHPENK